jgi:internalin A
MALTIFVSPSHEGALPGLGRAWIPRRESAKVRAMHNRVARVVSSFGILTMTAVIACEDPPKPEPKPAPAAPAPAAAAPEADKGKDKDPEDEDGAEPAAAAAPVEAKPVVCPKPPKVAFNDPSLEAEVRRKAGKAEGEVTLADLKKVRSVDLTRNPVDSLDPCVFPLLTNVHHLYLGGGALTDLTPLTKLTQIEGLRVSMNQVAVLGPLAGMRQMDQLDLGRTQVKDLTPLKGMTNLTELMLDDTPVDDLTPLANLTKLQRLSIKRTRVTDVSPLKGLKKLAFLYTGGSPISNVGTVKRSGLKISDDE